MKTNDLLKLAKLTINTPVNYSILVEETNKMVSGLFETFRRRNNPNRI